MSSATSATEAPPAPSAAPPEQIVFRWHPGAIVAIEAVTAGAKCVRLRCDIARSYRGGQHVDVRLTAQDGYRAQRSYSIASAADGGDTLELLIEAVPDGEVSGWFSRVAEVGDRVELRGPIGGSFSWDGPDGGPLLLAAGGSGVVPLLAMLRRRALAHPGIPAALIYSVRTRAEAMALAELEARDRAEPGFSLHLAATREPGGGRIDAGLVGAALERLGVDGRAVAGRDFAGRVFACGSNRFVGAACDLIMAAGIAPGLIRTERFGA